ncbi:MAG: acyloxyacyl hydrolase [Rickettsiales bacterium]|nr:acyloxyacyl hydrolase [Rickettsiales bacterium]
MFFAVMPARAADPMFDGMENQLAISSGVAIASQSLIYFPMYFVPYFTSELTYSQPNTVFRLPGRQNINIGKNIGRGQSRGWDWKLLNEYVFFLSEDAFLYNTENWYYGLGLGVGMQLDYNERIGSLLIFEFKMIVGRKISERANVELFFQHFSNGHTTENNYSYNFYGASVVFKF